MKKSLIVCSLVVRSPRIGSKNFENLYDSKHNVSRADKIGPKDEAPSVAISWALTIHNPVLEIPLLSLRF